ncbi:MAG TPA: hypothetical protein VFQ00_06800 [Terriglobales bacterium]|nr:hypothetical protein [Terriglobales bacterium]
MSAYAAQLRFELTERAATFARSNGHFARRSHEDWGSVVFEPRGLLHGNFHPLSYEAILQNPDWHARLGKSLTVTERLAEPEDDRRLRELDSCCSSDALLMNVFCHPQVYESEAVKRQLGIEADSPPVFGWRARVPLEDGKFDRTEVDMRWGDLLVEAKLTEPSFDSCATDRMRAYARFSEVFQRKNLPRHSRQYSGYQLLRNVLAADAHECSFCLLCDARRPDLIEAWFQVLSAIRSLDLRIRCKLLTWQELAPSLPQDLQDFLLLKYGISSSAD